MTEKTDLAVQRQEKLREIRKLGYDPYPHRYDLSHTVSDIVETCSEKSADTLEAEQISLKVAGRLMTLRGHGKVCFVDILSGTGRIQVYVRQDRVGEENYKLFCLLDVGDIVGIEGVMFRTKTDELTIFAKRVDLLAKALSPLPEKWHGLADVETRYRQRYLDLIANPDVRSVFVRRTRIISEIRQFLDSKGYMEVETPMMQPIAGGATARPFKTFHEALKVPLFLRIAPELYLKRLIVGGFERVYEINRNFRNEGISTQHNPEFTMLEFYQAYSDYEDLMDFTEKMLRVLVENITECTTLRFNDNDINFKVFHRYSMVESVQEFWKDSPTPSQEDLCDREGVQFLLGRLGEPVAEDEDWGRLLGRLFESVVEKNLIQPTFIYDFPTVLSPLSKCKDADPRFAERFEFFLGGLEIANA